MIGDQDRPLNKLPRYNKEVVNHRNHFHLATDVRQAAAGNKKKNTSRFGHILCAHITGITQMLMQENEFPSGQ